MRAFRKILQALVKFEFILKISDVWSFINVSDIKKEGKTGEGKKVNRFLIYLF